MIDEHAQAQRPGGRILESVTRQVVQLTKELGGKGPTKARTDWAGRDAIVVLLGGGYTVAEETLHQAGRGEVVREARRAFQEVVADRLNGLIERETGRRVRAVMGDSNQAPDLVVVVFVLDPVDPNSLLHAPVQELPEEP